MKNNHKQHPTFDDLFDGIKSKPLSLKEEKMISAFIKSRQIKRKDLHGDWHHRGLSRRHVSFSSSTKPQDDLTVHSMISPLALMHS